MAKVKVVPPQTPEEVHIVLSLEEATGIFNILDAGVSSGTVDDLGLRNLKSGLNSIRHKFGLAICFKHVGSLYE